MTSEMTSKRKAVHTLMAATEMTALTVRYTRMAMDSNCGGGGGGVSDGGGSGDGVYRASSSPDGLRADEGAGDTRVFNVGNHTVCVRGWAEVSDTDMDMDMSSLLFGDRVL